MHGTKAFEAGILVDVFTPIEKNLYNTYYNKKRKVFVGTRRVKLPFFNVFERMKMSEKIFKKRCCNLFSSMIQSLML